MVRSRIEENAMLSSYLFSAAASVALIIAAPTMPPQAQSTPPATATSADSRLLALFHESDEATLKRNPLNALYRGDLRHADRLGDYISPEYFDAERSASENDLRRLKAIDRTALTPINQLAYDVFKWQTEVTLRGLAPDLLALSAVRPIDHFTGIHSFYPDLASGQGAAPFKTLADYENNLKRHEEFVVAIDRSIARFREGLASGVVQPRLVIANVIGQLDQQLGQKVEDSPYYSPVKSFPAGISPPDQARLKTAYAAEIRDRIFPAYQRLRTFLQTEYLPKARDTVGLSGMKGGDRLYAFLIEQNTTLPLSADYVHDLGLSEVKRIKSEMERIKAEVGFNGTLPEFFAFIRTDPRFKPPSKEWLRDAYYAIGKRVDTAIPRLFSAIPKTPLEIRPVPDFLEKNQAAAYYQQGTPDGSRPGVFYFNTYDLPSRTTPGMETLYLHEAVPGHHFQISLAQENAALPAFMRFGGNTAFVEGWALYSESLWPELGLQTDPYQRFGGLDDEMLRAMRLVVDTGIHAKGWSRDRAIDYMMANSSMGKTDATAEVERYIAIPGQALAYKIGQLTFFRLKERAKKELGAKFDERAFHAQVLMTGALPMGVLEKKIHGWIAGMKAL
jgi:uncharacterized protein (DUF885 family)